LKIISIPREASTVIILRPAIDREHGPFEALMVQRHPDSLFVPDCYVFPGGCIDDDDCSQEIASFCRGLDRQKAFQILVDMPTEAMALGAWVAATRETFEETGLFLSSDPHDRPALNCYRRQLLDGETSFTDILKREKWTLSMDRLYYFAHWITPEFLPYRYDVRFFVTVAPEDQEATHDGIELTGLTWITPRRALAEYEENRFNMVLPTIMTLRELVRFNSIEAVIQSVVEKNVPSILTTVTKRNGRLVEIMPDGTIFSPVL
jgi:8-oxo-dGTP pyrophosphatase MutT (NUDIX family)